MTTSGEGWKWRPGAGTAAVLLISALLAGWLFTPTWTPERGVDARDLYAAASLQSRGGNPYDPVQQGAEQDRLFNAPANIRAGQAGYAHAPYGYPPIFTVVLQSGLFLGFDKFYLATLVVLLASGLLGFEAILRVSGLGRRWLARAFFLVSAPMALSLFVGNPSPILLLGWGLAALLLRRNRPFAGGLVLTLCLLKLPVGLPAAAALLVVTGTARIPMALGLGVGTAVLGSLQVLLSGPQATVDWVHGIGAYTSALGASSNSAYAQSGLAGMPALFEGTTALPISILIGLILIGGILVWSRRRLQREWTSNPNVQTAVLLLAALAATPYLHLNDLVLLSLPLLMLAQARPTVIGRITELAWFVGIPARLLLVTIAATLFNFHDASGPVGIGLLLVVLLMFALPISWEQGQAPSPIQAGA